jgi:uncharacterized protein YbjQ (UPF0145 family)
MELRHFTEAVYQARHLALSRMASEARQVGARGIVGSDVHLRVHEVGAGRFRDKSIQDHVVELTAVGTAVAAIKGGHHAVDVPLVLDVGQPSAAGHQLLAGR